MNVSEENIDQLILLKSYHELTADEKASIKDIAANETEFNETKMMLSSIVQQINEVPEITPKAETKESLIKEFNKFRPAKAERPAGLGVLFPSDKPFHKKLGVQILSIAAVIALIFTIYLPNAGKITNSGEVEKDMALNNEKKSEPIKTKEEKSILKENEKPKVVLEDSNTETILIMEESSVVANQNEQHISDAETKNKSDFNKNPSPSTTVYSSPAKPSFDAVADGIAQQDIYEMDDSESIAADEIEVLDNVATGNTMQVDNSLSYNEVESSAVRAISADKKTQSNGTLKDSDKSNIIQSKSLAQNKELIALFYTAM
jgi:hypothetical protein